MKGLAVLIASALKSVFVFLMLLGGVLMVVLSALIIDKVAHGAHTDTPPEGNWQATLSWPAGLMVGAVEGHGGAMINSHCPGCQFDDPNTTGGWIGVFDAQFVNDPEVNTVVFCSNALAIVGPDPGPSVRLDNEGALSYLLWRWSDPSDTSISYNPQVSAAIQALSWYWISDQRFGRSSVWTHPDGSAISPLDLDGYDTPWTVENPVGFRIEDESYWGTALSYNQTTADLFREATYRAGPWTVSADATGVEIISGSGNSLGYVDVELMNHLGETATAMTDNTGRVEWPAEWEQPEGVTWSASVHSPPSYVVEVRPGQGGQEFVLAGSEAVATGGHFKEWTTTTTTTTTIAPSTTTTIPPSTTTTTTVEPTTTTTSPPVTTLVTTTTSPPLPKTGGGVSPGHLISILVFLSAVSAALIYTVRKEPR